MAGQTVKGQLLTTVRKRREVSTAEEKEMRRRKEAARGREVLAIVNRSLPVPQSSENAALYYCQFSVPNIS
jgi:hypothetical protein